MPDTPAQAAARAWLHAYGISTSAYTDAGGDHPAMRTLPQAFEAFARGPQPSRRWRHKARGTVYTEVGRGELRASTGAPTDGQPIMVYRGEDGRLWVRHQFEFDDGRFESFDGATDA